MTLPRAMRVTVTALAVLGAACSDNPSGPSTITDPTATIKDLLAVDSAFNTAQFNALGSLANFLAAPAPPSPLRRVAVALRATLPPAPRALMSGTVRRTGQTPLSNVRPLAGLAGPDLVPVIPDSLLGITFVWNPDSLGYLPSSRTGAPQNGVRFVLYVPDTLTGHPDTAQEVGSLDIIDKAPAVGVQLQFVVRGVSGSPTFLDYTLTFLPAVNAFTVQAVGYVSNGLAGPLERRFTFDASITHSDVTNGQNESVDFTYSVNVPNVTVNLHLANDSTDVTNITSIDYRFSRRNENIRLLGADTTISGDENGTLGVTVNGHAYATAVITSGNGVIKDHNGTIVPINSHDQQYEDDVLIALLFGVFESTLILAVVLAIPAVLLGFSFGLL